RPCGRGRPSARRGLRAVPRSRGSTGRGGGGRGGASGEEGRGQRYHGTRRLESERRRSLAPSSDPPMPPRSLAVILNPAAGNRRAGRARADLVAELEASGAPFEVLTTRRPNHAAVLARDAAARFDAVIAAGGDGTLQEVASGLLAAEGEAVLGVIPLGTGNDFARLLGVPEKPAEAVRALLGAGVVPIDAGIVRWREATDDFLHEAAFVNAVGIGFDALAAAEAARFKWFRGRSGYLAAVFRALRLWPQPHVEVRCTDDGAPGERIYDGPFFLAAVSNGTAVGGGFRLTPDARPDDG